MPIEEGVHMAEVTAFEICIVLYIIQKQTFVSF